MVPYGSKCMLTERVRGRKMNPVAAMQIFRKMSVTAVIPLNNELVSEERDFACETTLKSRHI